VKTFQSKARAGVWVIILGGLLGGAACQLPTRNAATVIFQPVKPTASKDLAPDTSVLSVLRGAIIEKVYDDAGSWILQLTLNASVASKVRGVNRERTLEGVFKSAPENEEEDWMGEVLPATFSPDSDSEFSGFRVSFECVSDSCDSVLAEVTADPRTGLTGVARIEHRVIDDLVVSASRSGKLGSLELKQAVEWLQDSDTMISGRLIVDQVQGTSIRSVRAWAQILPLRTNPVFKRNAPREDEDLAERMEYFVRKVGVRVQQDANHQILSEEMFFSDYSPKLGGSSATAELSKGKWISGQVGLEPDPKSGRLRISLATRPSEDEDSMGLLYLTFRGERLLGEPISR